MELKANQLAEKFSLFDDYWNPKVVAELNGQHVKVAKFHGEFIRHDHANEDELFLVLRGSLCVQYRDEADSVKAANVEAGEFIVVPRGTQHRPIASAEVHVLLFEPISTVNTGSVEDSNTRTVLENN